MMPAVPGKYILDNPVCQGASILIEITPSLSLPARQRHVALKQRGVFHLDDLSAHEGPLAGCSSQALQSSPHGTHIRWSVSGTLSSLSSSRLIGMGLRCSRGALCGTPRHAVPFCHRILLLLFAKAWIMVSDVASNADGSE